ncbi:hypothetical protein M758_11G016800 [Ceratodon purpureus]|nr:hypothetical protein M758_11G016800 [Ceratodon purpureus]
MYIRWESRRLQHRSPSIPSCTSFRACSEFLCSTQSCPTLRGTNSQQWPRTLESVATATAQQAPAPRRTAASVATATAPQERARRRTEASAATATALPEPAPRNRFAAM